MSAESNRVLNVAILGLVHDHVWNYLTDLMSFAQARLVAVAEPHQELTDRLRMECHLPDLLVYDDWRQLIEEHALDVCLVFSETSAHCEIVQACAAKKIHVMLEKPMAINAVEGADMLRAMKAADRSLMVNYIIGFRAFIPGCLNALRQGEIGDTRSIRMVLGHKGPLQIGCSPFFIEWLTSKEKNGGGAMIDFGCYGAIIAVSILGMPHSVTAVAAQLSGQYSVEDDAIITLKYLDPPAVVTIEATWAQNLGGSYFQFFGSAGAIVNSPQNHNAFQRKEKDGSWHELEFTPLASGYDRPISYFLNCVLHDQQPSGLFNPETALAAQKILDAARISAERGVAYVLRDHDRDAEVRQ